VEAFVLNFLLWLGAGAELQAPTWWRCPLWFWLMSLPTHLAMRELTGWDYHWCRTLLLGFMTLGRRVLFAMPNRAAHSGSEIASSV